MTKSHLSTYYVDPKNITDFNRSNEQLQAFWLFCISVAGKRADTQAKKIAGFLEYASASSLTPFQMIKYYIDIDQLGNELREHGLGQYNRLEKAFEQSLRLDLRDCSLDDLEEIYGVGPKTARFFLLHSREDEELAVLDTHILKFIRDFGIDSTAPVATPSNKKRYRELEEKFLNTFSMSSLSIAEIDLGIWTYYNTKSSPFVWTRILDGIPHGVFPSVAFHH